MQRGRPGSNVPRIVTTARSMLIRHGPGVSLASVAAEMGLSRQTIYNHFQSKEELLLAVFEELRIEIEQRLEDAPWDASPAELLESIAVIVADQFLDIKMARLLRAMIQAFEEMPMLGAKVKSARTGQLLDRLIKYLSEKNRSGELNVENPELQAMLFLGSISDFLFPRLLLGTVLEDKSLNRAMTREAVRVFLQVWKSRDTMVKN